MVGHDRVEQVREGISGEFWEEGLPSCTQLQLECLYAAVGDLESLTSKPNAPGASKICVA